MFSETRAVGSRMVLSVFNVDFAFRFCPRGSFVMGSPTSELGRTESEICRCIAFERGFWILETPVTQTHYSAVMGNNPSCFVGETLPVENVSFFECLEFCERLNSFGIAPTGTFRLPSEAQWEYACRAGTSTPFYCGERLTKEDANFDFGSRADAPLLRTSPVGTYSPNPWGLYDMYGNVWERCRDFYDLTSKREASDQTPSKPGEVRVLRGGSWHSTEFRCRSAFRHKDPVEHKHSYLGFRIVLTIEE